MNAKNLLLGIFVVLTLAFASLTVGEFYQNQTKSVTKTQTTTTIMTITSTVICPSSVTCASFTYSQTGQMQVDYVQATESTFQNGGPPEVTFYVTVENIGSSPISFPSYALDSSIATNSSSVLQKIYDNQGLTVSEGVTLNHGQNYTLFAPYSGDGYYYKLIDPGSVNMNFGFSWTTSDQPCAQAPCNSALFSNSTTISAQFIFAST